MPIAKKVDRCITGFLIENSDSIQIRLLINTVPHKNLIINVKRRKNSQIHEMGELLKDIHG